MNKQTISAIFLLSAFTLFFTHPAYADSITTTDSCATIIITSSEPAADGSYSVAFDGRILNGYYYMASVFMDGSLIASGSSFWGTHYAATKGPFWGEHLFKLTMRGGTSHGICTSSAELKVAVVKDPVELSNNLCEAITALPGDAFKNNPNQRKNALCNKLSEVSTLADYGANSDDDLIKAQFFTEAIEKLGHDIGDKTDGSYNGTTKNDWIVDDGAQKSIFPKVEELQQILKDNLN